MGKQALEGSRFDAFNIEPEKLTIIGIDTPDTMDTHHLYQRRIMRPINESLILNIMKYGVIQAVKVQKDGDRTVVVAGRRRTMATRMANVRLVAAGMMPIKIPCFVQRGDAVFLYGVMISENEQRTDDLILDKAEQAAKMIAVLGATEEDVAVAFDLKARTVKNWLAINELHAEVKTAIRAGQLSAYGALKLASLRQDEQPAVLASILQGSRSDLALTDDQSAGAGALVVHVDDPAGQLSEKTAGGKSPAKASAKPEKKPTAKLVAQKAKAAKTGTEAVEAPSRWDLRRMLKSQEEGLIDLSDDVVKTIGIILGTTPAKNLPEFNKALRYVRASAAKE